MATIGKWQTVMSDNPLADSHAT